MRKFRNFTYPKSKECIVILEASVFIQEVLRVKFLGVLEQFWV